jgi:dipeptidyl aminopeptidase/acylaminoacyl peptidase
MTSHEPITFDRIADRAKPSGPRISPSGDAIAYTLSHLSKTDERALTEVWMARHGEEPFAFTGGKAGASDPQWSPDGTRIAFLSTRDDKDDRSGLFVIRAGGGEARQVGDVRGEISQPRWSPEGSRIAFLMKDPETEPEK